MSLTLRLRLRLRSAGLRSGPRSGRTTGLCDGQRVAFPDDDADLAVGEPVGQCRHGPDEQRRATPSRDARNFQLIILATVARGCPGDWRKEGLDAAAKRRVVRRPASERMKIGHLHTRWLRWLRWCRAH